MQAFSLTRDQILHDIETIYQRALADGKWSLALRAKEMQAKILGLFKPKPLPEAVRIADMSQDQLGEFIARLEENEPELKSQVPLKSYAANYSNSPGGVDKKPPEPESNGQDDYGKRDATTPKEISYGGKVTVPEVAKQREGPSYF